jgi:hypothetical protein
VAAQNNVTTADLVALQTMNNLMVEALKLVRHVASLHTALPGDTLDLEVEHYKEDRNKFMNLLRRALIQGRNRNARGGGPLANQPPIARRLVDDVVRGEIDERYVLPGTRTRVFDGMEDLVLALRAIQLSLERVEGLKATVDSMYEPARLTLRDRWRAARKAFTTGHCP